MTDYSMVLSRLYADKEWVLDGEDFDGLIWLDDNPKPDRSELDAAWPSVRDAEAWERVREERDRLLAQSDWTQVSDAPVDAVAWAAYRQALRDIPQTQDDPNSIVWPEAP